LGIHDGKRKGNAKPDPNTVERERANLARILNNMGLAGVGAEIGVYKGDHAKKLLSIWKGKRLICVDHWTVLDEKDPRIVPFLMTKEELDAAKATAFKNLKDEKRCEIIEAESTDAARLIKDESLDFVYIDTAHDYKAVTRDLNAWCDKVKDGGLITGHDFVNVPKKGIAVVAAVCRFFGRRAPVYIFNRHHERPDFIVKKGGKKIDEQIILAGAEIFL